MLTQRNDNGRTGQYLVEVGVTAGAHCYGSTSSVRLEAFLALRDSLFVLTPKSRSTRFVRTLDWGLVPRYEQIT